MKFLLQIVLGAVLGVALATPVLPVAVTSRSSFDASADSGRLRLAWFNSLDRSFSLEVPAGAVRVTLHAPNGNLLSVVHQGPLANHEILRVSEDLPPGVYLLRIWQPRRQTLDRVTLF